MSTHFHAVIWIDHREARVFHFNATEVDRIVIHPDNPTRHIHHKSGSLGAGHAVEDKTFLSDVVAAASDAGAILITGPAGAKTALVKYMHRQSPALADKIAGIETSDHPSDGALVAHARHYFKAADRMTR